MTFLAGWRLVFLLVPLALLVVYVIRSRRQAQVAVRFSSVDLLASVVPRRTGWQRHLPWAALLMALVIGVLAFANPAMALKVPKERATIILVMDSSRSMEANDIPPNRLIAAQEAARSFVSELPPKLQAGLVTFDESARLAQPPSTDRSGLTRAIDSIRLGQGTDTGAGLQLALDAIEAVPPDAEGQKAPAAIVLLSDGAPTLGTGGMTPEESVIAAAQRAAESGVPISTIAFGTDAGTVTIDGVTIPVPSDPETLQGVAQTTGGQAFTAESAAELDSVYNEIGTSVGYDVETQDVSALFAGAALLMGALAAAAALIWSQQLA